MKENIFRYNLDRLRHKVVNLLCLRCKSGGFNDKEETIYQDYKKKYNKAAEIWYKKELIQEADGFNDLVNNYVMENSKSLY